MSGGSGMVHGSQHGRDCGGIAHVRGMEMIRCAGYDNKRVSTDYTPRDSRPFLSACRDRNCPADRCLDMPEEAAGGEAQPRAAHPEVS